VSRPIQTNPFGLLGALQLKNSGTNPPDLIDSVQPTLDLWRHYIAQSRTISSANFNVNAFGFNASAVAVPNDEVWMVSELMLTSNGVLAALQSVDWAPAWQDVTGVVFIIGDYKSAGPGEAPQIGANCNGLSYAIVPPGAVFGACVRTFATGPIASQLSVRRLAARV